MSITKSSFSQTQLNAIKRQFMVFADPKTGLLDKNNCKTLFRSMGQVPLESDLTQWVKEYYTTLEGKQTEGIVFDQYLSFFCRYQHGTPMVQTVINIFHSFDPDRTGFLHKTALKKILSVGPTALNEDEISQFLRICSSIIPENPAWVDHIDYVRLANAMMDPQTFFRHASH